MKRLVTWTIEVTRKQVPPDHTVMVWVVLEIASENQKGDSEVIFCLSADSELPSGHGI